MLQSKPPDWMKIYYVFFEFRGWTLETYKRTPTLVIKWLLQMMAENHKPGKFHGMAEHSLYRILARTKGAEDI